MSDEPMSPDSYTCKCGWSGPSEKAQWTNDSDHCPKYYRIPWKPKLAKDDHA